jgi:pyruvate dehydrogenase E2 component (dihydrolipoamide acetyltransferase)
MFNLEGRVTMISKNVKLSKKRHYNSWDKVNLGSWSVNGDSQIYCELKLEAQEALNYLKIKNENQNTKVTITHFLGKVMGNVLRDLPELNVMVRHNKIFLRDEVNIFFHVADKGDLSGHCVKKINEKSIISLADELSTAAKNIRTNNDETFKNIKKSWKLIPVGCSKFILGVIRFINYNLNLSISALGIPKDPFGGLMITNIGSLGFDSAFAPLPPYTEVPFLIALGKIKYEPICDEQGNIEAKKMVTLCITMDHRIIDGYRGSFVAKEIKKYFNQPELLSI